MDKFIEISPSHLVPPKIHLRLVQQTTVEFLEMKDSIEKEGLLNSILVRPSSDYPDKYEIIDGMYRFTCAKSLCLDYLPAIIKYGVSDFDALLMQIQANSIRPKTKPCEFAKQLQRIQKEIPQIPLSKLAMMVSKSPEWVCQQLKLLSLTSEQRKMVDRSEICLMNAYMLVKLPGILRGQYVDKAKVMKANKFKALVAGALKKYREDIRKGKLTKQFCEKVQPQAYLRPLKEIISGSEKVAPLILASEKCKTALDGWKAAIKWALHLDKKSIKDQMK